MVFIETGAGQCWRREFPGVPEQARAVRRFLSALLDDCSFLDDVLFGCDELAVNTLRHTRSGQAGGSFTVEVRRWCGPLGPGGKECEQVAVVVLDQGGPGEPVVRVAGESAESGRGLWTVSQLAARWGWFGNADGRSVCAVFAAPELLAA